MDAWAILWMNIEQCVENFPYAYYKQLYIVYFCHFLVVH